MKSRDILYTRVAQRLGEVQVMGVDPGKGKDETVFSVVLTDGTGRTIVIPINGVLEDLTVRRKRG